jgi:hypothetical protein
MTASGADPATLLAGVAKVFSLCGEGPNTLPKRLVLMIEELAR